MQQYTVWLGDTALPVAPAKISRKVKGKNKTETLISDQEINTLRLPGLLEVTFDILLPAQVYPWTYYPGGFRGPFYYIDRLNKLKSSRQPFVFKTVRLETDLNLFDTSITASLEEFTVEDDAKEGRDIKASLKLKQYVPYGTKVLTLSQNSAGETVATVGETRPTTGHETPESHVVDRLETLPEISKRYLGDASRWQEIYTLNQTALEAKARESGRESSSWGLYLYPGTVLSLPQEVS